MGARTRREQREERENGKSDGSSGSSGSGEDKVGAAKTRWGEGGEVGTGTPYGEDDTQSSAHLAQFSTGAPRRPARAQYFSDS